MILGGMGPMELVVILLIVLVIFGPKNLPKLGKSLGSTVRNIREGMEGDEDEVKEAATKVEAKAEKIVEEVKTKEEDEIAELEAKLAAAKAKAAAAADSDDDAE